LTNGAKRLWVAVVCVGTVWLIGSASCWRLHVCWNDDNRAAHRAEARIEKGWEVDICWRVWTWSELCYGNY